MKPGGRVIVIMTRWHEDDLGGHLLANSPDEWRVLKLPALAEPDDPLGRQVGEPLWPSWEDRAALERKRQTIGERAWMSLFQQSPRPATGSVFKVTELAILESPPAVLDSRVVRAWDLAATVATAQNDPDWTVGVKMSRDAQHRFTVLDVVRLRGTPRQIEDLIVSTAQLDGQTVWVGLPEDPGQAGKSQISYLAGRLAGFRLMASRETGSKLTRAIPFSSQVEAGNVALVRANWNYQLIEEMRDFPVGRKDDQVDAMVRAFNTFARVGDPPKLINIPLLHR